MTFIDTGTTPLPQFGNFLTAKGISSVAIELLVRTMVLPMTVVRIPGDEFSGSNGDSITVRVPNPQQALEQATRGATITYDTLTELTADVTLKHLYNATRVTDEDMSLSIEQFAVQVTQNQVQAVATAAEDTLSLEFDNLTPNASIANDGSDIKDRVLEARETLGKADVPAGERWLAVSPEVATFMLSIEEFSRFDAMGDATALREAMLGRIFGFNVVESNALAAGTAVAYHRTGFAFANRTPVMPRGANDSATANSQGVGLRQIFQYDPDVLSDASVVSTFAGATVVDTARTFKLDTAAA